MKKLIGIASLLLLVVVIASLLSRDPETGTHTFLTAYNIENLLQRIGMFGVLSIAAMFVIVTGGIDLSIGAVVCVVGCVLPWLTRDLGWSPYLALPAALLLAGCIGLWHGLLVTWLGLQSFVVTLCGLLIYRGLMRWFTHDQTMGFGSSGDGLRYLATGRIQVTATFGLPVAALLLLVVAILAAVFMNRTVWGRQLFALGRNEEAARFSGVPTRRLSLLAYVLCSLLAGLGGALFVLDVNSAQASSFGNFYELYAIAGAVLGGVALRGGEGTVIGVVLGAALMQVLSNAINLVADSTQLEFAVVGAVILFGAAADEGVRKLLSRRRAS
ncbi:sugar ABC transporter permease [Planctomycetota bacterium]|nr:ABC transporter permease [Planctomycetota bacterium]MSR38056.1 ABC transporter permease [Planctomycetota bacterium]GDY02059.1 sugar ABC transporter permease [Planctomycetota bacterium]